MNDNAPGQQRRRSVNQTMLLMEKKEIRCLSLLVLGALAQGPNEFSSVGTGFFTI